jgi:hypothetical protein
MPRLRSGVALPEEILSLRAAAELTGQSVIRLGRWCATGKLRCEPSADGWAIPVSELAAIAVVAGDQARAVKEKRITAIAVPAPAAPPDLGDQVASRLGLTAGQVSVTPLALDGVEYVVAVWRGVVSGTGGLPALSELALDLDGELLDGEVKQDWETAPST